MEARTNRVKASSSPLKILFIFASITAIFLSLMTFPAGIPWMLVLWFAFSLLRYQVKRTIWVPLVVCAFILIVKRPGFTLELGVVVAAILGVAIVDFRDQKPTVILKADRTIPFALILVASWALFSFTRYQASTMSSRIELNDGPVVCLGDSLTAYGYPQELEKLISVPVEDFGFDGITTQDGIEMVAKILATKPQAVVLELGGHDFNQGQSRSHTRKNLQRLIEAFQKNHAEVILVEVPRGFISDSYDGLERELSSKYDLQLVSDSVIRSFVLNGPVMPPGAWMSKDRHLSSDGLHPNALGNKRFAKVVSQALRKIYGEQILMSD